MNKEKLKKELKELFEDDMDIDELIQCWNNYCGEVNGNKVYCMEELENICLGMSHLESIERCYYGHFDPNDDFFKFNEYTNFDSFSDFELLENIDVEEVINYIIRTEKNLWNQDIELALRNCEE